MNHSNRARGRGTVETPVFPRVRIKSGKEKGRELISANSETALSTVPRPLFRDADRAALAAYLAANPGMTARDFKGKGFSTYQPFQSDYEGPNEQPWHELSRDDVRRIATSDKARFLPRNVRMAAARDTGLEWDGQALAYRLRLAGPSPVSPASGDGDRPGGAESFRTGQGQTGDGHEKDRKHSIRGGDHG